MFNVAIERFKLKRKPKLMSGGKFFVLEISPAVEVSFPKGKKELIEKIIINKGNGIETDGLELEKDRYVTFETPLAIGRCEIDNNALVINNERLGKIKAKVEKSELEEILEGINDNFDLTTSPSSRTFICPQSGNNHQKSYFSATELKTITDTICQYIKNHQD